MDTKYRKNDIVNTDSANTDVVNTDVTNTDVVNTDVVNSNNEIDLDIVNNETNLDIDTLNDFDLSEISYDKAVASQNINVDEPQQMYPMIQ